jgi:hypothetical protein
MHLAPSGIPMDETLQFGVLRRQRFSIECVADMRPQTRRKDWNGWLCTCSWLKFHGDEVKIVWSRHVCPRFIFEKTHTSKGDMNSKAESSSSPWCIHRRVQMDNLTFRLIPISATQMILCGLLRLASPDVLEKLHNPAQKKKSNLTQK